MEEATQKDEAYYRELYRADMAMISTEGLLAELLRRCHGTDGAKALLRGVREGCCSMRTSDNSSSVPGDVVAFCDAWEEDDGPDVERWTIADMYGHSDRWGHGMLVLENAKGVRIKSCSDLVTIIDAKQWEL